MADERDPDTADRGQQDRFNAFVAEHWERAIRLAWRLTDGDAAAAEDVAQEAFVRAHRALGRFRGDASLSTWYYRILVREAHRHRRWLGVRQRFAANSPAEDALDPQPDALPDPGLRKRIGDALARLPRGQREAFVLVHMEGFTVTQAADVTGRAVGTVKSHLHRALRALRVDLADLRKVESDG